MSYLALSPQVQVVQENSALLFIKGSRTLSISYSAAADDFGKITRRLYNGILCDPAHGNRLGLPPSSLGKLFQSLYEHEMLLRFSSEDDFVVFQQMQESVRILLAEIMGTAGTDDTLPVHEVGKRDMYLAGFSSRATQIAEALRNMGLWRKVQVLNTSDEVPPIDRDVETAGPGPILLIAPGAHDGVYSLRSLEAWMRRTAGLIMPVTSSAGSLRIGPLVSSGSGCVACLDTPASNVFDQVSSRANLGVVTGLLTLEVARLSMLMPHAGAGILEIDLERIASRRLHSFPQRACEHDTQLQVMALHATAAFTQTNVDDEEAQQRWRRNVDNLDKSTVRASIKMLEDVVRLSELDLPQYHLHQCVAFLKDDLHPAQQVFIEPGRSRDAARAAALASAVCRILEERLRRHSGAVPMRTSTGVASSLSVAWGVTAQRAAVAAVAIEHARSSYFNDDHAGERIPADALPATCGVLTDYLAVKGADFDVRILGRRGADPDAVKIYGFSLNGKLVSVVAGLDLTLAADIGLSDLVARLDLLDSAVDTEALRLGIKFRSTAHLDPSLVHWAEVFDAYARSGTVALLRSPESDACAPLHFASWIPAGVVADSTY
jgi:hypothetical protein